MVCHDGIPRLAIPRLLARLRNPRINSILEAHVWVEHIQKQYGRNNDRTLESDEVLLCGSKITTPALAQFGNAEHASCEDAESGE